MHVNLAVMHRYLLLLCAAFVCRGQAPEPVQGDWTIHNFVFQSGEKLENPPLHYTTLGKPARNAAGHVRNAVLILHGTTGSGRPFLGPNFGGQLFGPGQPLDAATHCIILPDDMGTVKSKPHSTP